MRQAVVLQDRLVVAGGMEFRWSFPELERITPCSVGFSYTVVSEEELRELIELCGGARAFFEAFDVSQTSKLLTALGLVSEGGRQISVFVHLKGEDFAPAPSPAPLVERLRQEGLQAIDGALAAADRDRAEPGFGAAEAVALTERDRLAATDGC